MRIKSHIPIWVGSFLILLMSGITALWATALAFSEVTPRTTSAYQVQSVQDSNNNAQVLASLEHLSSQGAGDVSTFGFEDLGGQRVLYTTKNIEYHQGILSDQKIPAQPLTAIPHQDPRTIFLIEGNSQFQHKVVDTLSSLGVSGELLTVREFHYLLDGTNLARLLFLAAGVVAVVMVLAAVIASRLNVISRLHGAPLAGTVTRALAKPMLTAFGCGVLTVALLSLIRSPDIGLQFGRYLLLAAAALSGIGIFSFASTLGLLRLSPIVPTLAGKTVMLPALTVSAALRIFLVSICLVWATVAVRYDSEYKAQREEMSTWAHSPAAFSVTVTGARTIEDRQDLQHALAGQLREFSAQGQVFYHRHDVPGTDTRIFDQTSDLLSINRTSSDYSLPQELKSILNSQFTPGDIVVFAPASSNMTESEMHTHVPACAQEPTRCAIVPVDHPYQVFGWQVSEDEFQTRALLNSPIVTVLPNDLGAVSDRELTASLSAQQLSFTSIEPVEILRTEDPRLTTYFSTISQLSSTWFQAHEKTKAARTLSITVSALTFGFIVLFGGLYGILLVMGYGQRARAYRLFGLSAFCFYTKVALWDLMVLAGGAFLIWRKVQHYDLLASGALGPMPESFLAMFYVSPLAMGIVVASMLCSALCSLALISRRITC